MARAKPKSVRKSDRPHNAHQGGTFPKHDSPAATDDRSDVAPVEPELSTRDVERPAEAAPGGLDNLPVEALTTDERAAEHFDHERLDDATEAAQQ